jgi:hypothetical protein
MLWHKSQASYPWSWWALLQDITSVESKACFILGVGANVQPKSSIPIGAKVEISPKGGLYIMSQGWNRKKKINLPPSY